MPVPATVPEFLDMVRKSGLLPDQKLDEAIDRHRSAATFPTSIDQLSSLLVREGLLTYFQSKQLKLGRYKRFTIGSKYRLLELIGAGGMGAVYLCEHMLMRRLVALKVLPVEKLEDPSNLERFYREARAVAALDHPNIVRAYDIDLYDKLHFLVMEYVDGNSLQEIVARHRPLDPIRAAHYISQSAIGLQHAHELGMVHRDIKPGNLLLERTGVIKILDMGLARFFNKSQDNVTEKYDEKCVLGTADYLAPEQAVSSSVDIRADIYSLGGTLYFLLTGQTPFPDGSIAAKLVAHQNSEPKPVEALRQDVPPALLGVLKKMMAKDPADRYQDPIDVADALAEWADQPIAAPVLKEMPALCPAVLALSATNSAKTGSSSARASYNRGRTAVASPGRRSSLSTAKAAGSISTSTPPGLPGKSLTPLSTGSPNSTGKASTARTAPTTARPGNPTKTEPPLRSIEAKEGSTKKGSLKKSSNHRRNDIYLALGLGVGLVIALGLMAIYYVLTSQ